MEQGNRSNLIQFSWVSWHSLVNTRFKVWLHLSTFSDNWGLWAEWKVHFMPRTLVTPLFTWDTNAGSSLLCRDPGNPNLKIIIFSNTLATSDAVSVLAENASVHLENVCTRTKGYLNFPSSPDRQGNQSSNFGQDIALWFQWALSGGLWGGWFWGCSLYRWCRSQLSHWLNFSCQKLPWPQVTNYIGIPTWTEFLDEPPRWLDKLQLGK